jgi:hypothetical protein
MRPQSIVNFERLLLLLIVLGLVGTVLDWERTVALAARQGLGSGVVVAITVVSVAIYALLLWLIARRRSLVAVWIYVALVVIGLLYLLMNTGELMRQSTPMLLLQAVQCLLSLVSIWLLFRPDSRAWFQGDARPAA